MDLVAQGDAAGEDLLGQVVLDHALDRAAQGARAIGGIEALLGEELQRLVVPGQVDVALGKARGDGLHHEPRDAQDVLLVQGVEDDQLVHAVEEFGAEGALELLEHGLLHALIGLHGQVRAVVGEAEPARVLAHVRGADVAGHDDDGVAEVHRAARESRSGGRRRGSAAGC